MSLESINPYSGVHVETYPEMADKEIDQVLSKAKNTFLKWKRSDFKSRSESMLKVAESLKGNEEKLAHIITQEMGKPFNDAKAEVQKCAKVCEYYAHEAESMLQDESIKTEAAKSYVHYEPLGVVLAVMPWNFPLWQVYRCFAPSIMAGNVIVLKHASSVTGCALAIEEIAKESGVPDGVFQNLLISVPKIKSVIQDERVAAVTLTGSTPAGKAVASQAGEVLKKCVLELGGSDPYIILEDADIELAVEACTQSRMINGGQSCVAAKRFIVHKKIKSIFEQSMVRQMEKFVMGDPEDAQTTLGPMARMDLRQSIHDQVQRTIDQGAVCLTGGKIPKLDGAFYPPTVLTNVKQNMASYSEEIFGPVATIIEAENDEDAIRIANDSIFGLGGAVFTKDIKRGEEIAAYEIETGSCFVNMFVKSDPRLPFGGIKQSGYGRELGICGIREFMNTKTICVA